MFLLNWWTGKGATVHRYDTSRDMTACGTYTNMLYWRSLRPEHPVWEQLSLVDSLPEDDDLSLARCRRCFRPRQGA